MQSHASYGTARDCAQAHLCVQPRVPITSTRSLTLLIKKPEKRMQSTMKPGVSARAIFSCFTAAQGGQGGQGRRGRQALRQPNRGDGPAFAAAAGTRPSIAGHTAGRAAAQAMTVRDETRPD